MLKLQAEKYYLISKKELVDLEKKKCIYKRKNAFVKGKLIKKKKEMENVLIKKKKEMENVLIKKKKRWRMFLLKKKKKKMENVPFLNTKISLFC